MKDNYEINVVLAVFGAIVIIGFYLLISSIASDQTVYYYDNGTVIDVNVSSGGFGHNDLLTIYLKDGRVLIYSPVALSEIPQIGRTYMFRYTMREGGYYKYLDNFTILG